MTLSEENGAHSRTQIQFWTYTNRFKFGFFWHTNRLQTFRYAFKLVCNINKVQFVTIRLAVAQISHSQLINAETGCYFYLLLSFFKYHAQLVQSTQNVVVQWQSKAKMLFYSFCTYIVLTLHILYILSLKTLYILFSAHTVYILFCIYGLYLYNFKFSLSLHQQKHFRNWL